MRKWSRVFTISLIQESILDCGYFSERKPYENYFRVILFHGPRGNAEKWNPCLSWQITHYKNHIVHPVVIFNWESDLPKVVKSRSKTQQYDNKLIPQVIQLNVLKTKMPSVIGKSLTLKNDLCCMSSLDSFVCKKYFSPDPEYLDYLNILPSANLDMSWEVQPCLFWFSVLWEVFPCLLAHVSFFMHEEKPDHKHCTDSCTLRQKFYIFFYDTMNMHFLCKCI